MATASLRRLLPVGVLCLIAACSPATATPAPATAGTSQPAVTTAAPAAPATTEAASPGTGAAGGGQLSMAVEGDLQSLDPAICYDSNCIPVVRALFDQLLVYEPNSTVLRPGLAADMPEVSADGLQYTFKLRPATFTKPDGTVLREVTADDVAYSLNRLLDQKLTPYPSPVGPAFFSLIAGADKVIDGSAQMASGLEVLDPSTIRITITEPNRAFLNILAMTFGSIVPKELAGTDTTAFSAAPVGSGAFYLESYAKGDKAVLKRNTAYWDPERPKVDSLEYRLLVDANTQLQQVQAGQLDVMGNDIPAGAYTATVNDPQLKDRVHRASLVATNFLIADSSGDTPIANTKVRQAIAHAIDKENLIKVANGRGVIANCVFPPQVSAYDPACNPYAYDVEKAKALMADAGYADGFSTTIYTDTQDISKALSESVIQDLAAIGITADLVQQDFDVLVGTITTPHAAPLTYLGWFQDFPDPSDFYDPILSCAVNVPGGASYGWYCNEAADALAAKARGEADATARDQMYRDLQGMVMADVPSIPLTHPETVILVSDRVVGEPLGPSYVFDLIDLDAAE